MNATRIRELRLERGLTQDQLADLAKVSQPTLSQYELGSALPSLKSAMRIARALGVSMDTLINCTEEDKEVPSVD